MGTSAKGDNLMSNTAAAANKAVSDVFATLVDELGLIKAQIAELENVRCAFHLSFAYLYGIYYHDS